MFLLSVCPYKRRAFLKSYADYTALILSVELANGVRVSERSEAIKDIAATTYPVDGRARA